MIPLCQADGIGIIPWSPLARGFLVGNRSRADNGNTVRGKSDTFSHEMYYQESDFDVVDHVREIAQKLGCTPAQIALAWMLHKPWITAPIIGATKMPHLEQAVGALEIQLSPEDIAYLEEPYQPHPVLGHT